MLALIKVNGEVHKALVTEQMNSCVYLLEGSYQYINNNSPVKIFEVIEEIKVPVITPTTNPIIQSFRDIMGQDIAGITFK